MALGNDVTLKVGFDIDKFNAELKRTNASLNSWATGVKSLLGGIAIGSTLMSVGKEMFEVTAQFQKFGAILGNTLGSNTEAQKALDKIRQFAIETPFEVAEVTAAYVRWANMGLDPTIDRMGKLGDVASSLGAGFEQTAEAFKDLMVGQTKRIEEIGISAQQSNGKIQLSFKGVNLEIEKNAEGVQKALEVYSQLNGVLGTSELIAKTLGGQFAALSDSWKNFLLSIGNDSSGLMGSVITKLTNELNELSNNVKTIDFLAKWVKTKFRDLTTSGGGATTTWEDSPALVAKNKAIADALLAQKKAAEDAKKAYDELFHSQVKVFGGTFQQGAISTLPEGHQSMGMPGQVGGVAGFLDSSKMAEMQANAAAYMEVAQGIADKNQEMKDSFEMMAASAIVSFAEAFGGGEDLGKAFLKSLARLGAQFGAFLITMGIATMQVPGGQAKGLRQIAAGTALVAGSAALGAIASSMGGGASGSGGVGNVGDGRGVVNSNSQNSAGSYSNVTFRVRGSDLIGAMESAKYDNQLRRGG